MTDKMNLKAANARPSPPSITGEPGASPIARATDGEGVNVSDPASDNSLLTERVTLRSSGESRKVNKPLRLDADFEGAGDHIGDGNKMGGQGDLISRERAAHDAYVGCAETRHVSLGLKAAAASSPPSHSPHRQGRAEGWDQRKRFTSPMPADFTAAINARFAVPGLARQCIAASIRLNAVSRALSSTGHALVSQYRACSIVEMLRVSPSATEICRGLPQSISIIRNI